MILLASALFTAAADAKPQETKGRASGVAGTRRQPAARQSAEVRARPLSPGGMRVLRVERPPYVGEPISLDLKDADIRDVLLTIAKVARLNIVIDPEVKGSVTVRLETFAGTKPWT